MQNKKIRGVNLGGWLVLETYMTPSLFKNLDNVKDETSFCLELGEKAQPILRKHWETFITEEDFKWLADIGINTVRIPFAHWIFGDVKPYYGSIDILDWAVKTAEKYSIDVLLDIHTAPGCQNGFDNGGIKDVIGWHLDPENINQSVEFAGRIAERYKDCANVMGLSLLNEPLFTIPIDIVKDFYTRAYREARKHFSEDKTIFMDCCFRFSPWKEFLIQPEFKNVVLDVHPYQCFMEEQRKMKISQHLHTAAVGRKEEFDKVSERISLVAGEWSLMLHDDIYEGMDEFQFNAAHTAYGHAQLMTYECYRGWIFWSYKVEEATNPSWSFRECVKRGWLPGKY